MIAQAPFDISDTIFRGASRIHRMQIEALAAADERLTLRQFRTLQRVYEGMTSLSEISRRAQRSLPTTSETVDGLVRRGMLARQESVDDRRAVVLTILAKGVAAYHAGAEKLRGVDDLIRAGLDDDEYAQLLSVMATVLANSEEWVKV